MFFLLNYSFVNKIQQQPSSSCDFFRDTYPQPRNRKSPVHVTSLEVINRRCGMDIRGQKEKDEAVSTCERTLSPVHERIHHLGKAGQTEMDQRTTRGRIKVVVGGVGVSYMHLSPFGFEGKPTRLRLGRVLNQITGR